MIENIHNIRNYLLQNVQFKALLDNKDAIYLIEKPLKTINNPYVVYLYKPIGTGNGVLLDAQVEFRIVGTDLNKLTQLQSLLITLLDQTRNSIPIDGIRFSKLLNGGGMLRNETTKDYEIIVFFNIKL